MEEISRTQERKCGVCEELMKLGIIKEEETTVVKDVIKRNKEKLEMKKSFVAEVTAQKHIIIPDAVSKLFEIEEGQIVEVSISILKK